MANRMWTEFQYSLEKRVVNLFASVAVGATGAPTLNAASSKGIKSVVRNSAGNYTINLSDTYQRLLFMDSAVVLGSGAPSSGTTLQMIIRADNSNNQTTPNVQVEFLNSSGTAVDLASGATLLLAPQLSNSTAI